MSDLSNQQKGRTVIEDGAAGHDLTINADGSINVLSTSGGTTEADKTFGISEELTPSSASETAVILLKNPTANSVDLALKDLLVSALAPDFGSVVRLYSSPTITANGTSATITNFLIGSGSSSSVMEAYTNPTISVNGTLLLTSSILKAITAESDREFTFSRIVTPDNSILVTIDNTATNRTAAITMSWKEE